MLLLLLFIPSISLAYIRSNDSRYIPVFSDRNDMYLEAGQQFNVNCSFYDRFLTRCPVAKKPSSKDNTSQTDCQNKTNAFPEARFDTNSMKILHCPTNHRDNCTVQNTTVLNNRTLYLHKKNLSVLDTGTYVCQYNRTITTESAFYMKIGYKPNGPDNISCISEDLYGLHCSWSRSQPDLHNPFPVKYKSYFISSPQYGRFDCPHPTPQGCTVLAPGVKGEKYTYDSLKNFVFFVNASTVCCGSHISEYTVKPEEIVKLSPPMITSVKIAERNITFMMQLGYKTRKALIVIKNILYDISYKTKYSDIKTYSLLSNGSNIPVTLIGLSPFTQYIIYIRNRGSKTKGNNYWSSTVIKIYTTKSAAPDTAPVISSGGFYRHNNSTFLYLKPISETEMNAADGRYRITTCDNFGQSNVYNVSWEQTTVKLLNIFPHYTYHIEIHTVNDIGHSRNMQRIKIPAIDIARKLPEYILVEKSSQNYTLSWSQDNMSTIKRILVYWCHGNRQNYMCKSDLNWIEIDQNSTSLTIDGLEDKNGGDWMFAISYQYTDGYNTGMTFVQCYFSTSPNLSTSIPPYNVIAASPTQIQIRPLVYCSKYYTSRPLQYVVYYKEQKWDDCDKSFKNKTVTANFNVEKVTIQNLKPSTYYTICLSVITKRIIKVSTASHTRTLGIREMVSYTVYIVILCMVGIMVCVILALIMFCKIRNMCNEPMDINLPKLNTKYKKVEVSDLDGDGSFRTKIKDSGYNTTNNHGSVNDENYIVKKVTKENAMIKCGSFNCFTFNSSSEQYLVSAAESTVDKAAETRQSVKIDENTTTKKTANLPCCIENDSNYQHMTEIPSQIQSQQVINSSSYEGKHFNLPLIETSVQTTCRSTGITSPKDNESASINEGVNNSSLKSKLTHVIDKKTKTSGYICEIPNNEQFGNERTELEKSITNITDIMSEQKQNFSCFYEVPGTGYVLNTNLGDNKNTDSHSSEISDYTKATKWNSNISECSEISDYTKTTQSNSKISEFSEISDYTKATQWNSNISEFSEISDYTKTTQWNSNISETDSIDVNSS